MFAHALPPPAAIFYHAPPPPPPVYFAPPPVYRAPPSVYRAPPPAKPKRWVRPDYEPTLQKKPKKDTQTPRRTLQEINAELGDIVLRAIAKAAAP